ncbi:glycosyl hydrolase family 43 (plasmid) [Fulvitalea axinellae]|uniref:Glycosyl hydrolase family 43 n=1 Tax=Fulvitalea axinellae TaxID=1182444 RepID=A0AAU9D508_9BACT|nr:glycosyl hydrolase family 43 [Fulvitalea axinellae]
MRLNTLLSFLITVCFLAQTALAQNKTIKPDAVWKDSAGKRINAHGGCVISHGGIYYWYGEEKEKGLSEKEHADAGVHCYASSDLVNWHDQGLVLKLIKGETLSDLAFDSNHDRPKVVYNEATRKFVMFFKLYLRGKGHGVAYVGVATSDSPVGPFVYKHKFLGGGSPNGTGDFAIYKDDDGKLYHLSVRKPDKAFVIGKMRDDYLMPEGKYQICEGVTRHTEAPAIFKKDGIYHMLASGSTGWAPNPARHFTARNIYGPWKFRGNPCQGTNPHNNLGPDKTFGGQSNFVLKVDEQKDAYIAIFDINKPKHPYESAYIWLPIKFKGKDISILWQDAWSLDVFRNQ